MRKGKVALILMASILWSVGFFVSPSHGKLIVGLSSVNVAFLPVYVTEDRGFFKDEGLDVLLVLFNAGATNLQALVGGDIQIMGSAFVETLGGRGAGFDVKNFWGICNLMPFQLYSQPDFKSMKQAKGKRFAISRFGSLTDFLTRATLRHFGVDPKEVTILQIGSTPARFAALTAKGVDASVVWFPVTEIAKSQGYNKLLDLKDVLFRMALRDVRGKGIVSQQGKRASHEISSCLPERREIYPREQGRFREDLEEVRQDGSRLRSGRI